MHLTARPITSRGDSPWQVTHGDGEIIVAETNSINFVADTITALKMMGVDHNAQIIIHGVCGNPAYNGALKHHDA
jgi:hypothetical protein